MGKLGVAVIGCGGISEYHIPGMLAVDEARIVAACDRDADKARSAAEKYGIPKVYTDSDAVFNDDEVQAVMVLTPNFTHKDLAIMAARAGKHVLMQKPFARSVAECNEMIAAAREAGTQLIPSFMHRFLTESITAKSYIEQGLIGRPMTVRIRNAVGGATHAAWFFDRASTGGGAVIDVGVHGIDLLRYLIGEVEEVAAMTTTHQAVRHMDDGSNVTLESEDSATITYRLANNVLAVHEVSWSQKAGCKRFEAEIYGDEGTIYLRTAMGPLALASKRLGTTGNWFVPELPKYPFGYQQHKAFVDTILGSSAPTPRAEDGLATIRVVEAIYRSATEETFVKIARGESDQSRTAGR